ncbi:MAG TPA: SDR family oxidoreductase [Alphaproteobacteria bacterium]|nr:SDR family oxidoreductase [Alphaproteobacteria bacterium]
MPRLFCFGLGYSALHLADRLIAEGWEVAGTCRTEAKQAMLSRRGIETHLFDRGRPLDDAGAAFGGTTHLLSAVPPDGEGDPVLDHHGADLARLRGLAWVGYLSTTSVYGDRAGGWVDEESARHPMGPRGRRRAAAEDGWLALWRDCGVPAHLFRLSGIYGPGRSAIDAVRAGTAKRIDKPGHVFNRIHVADIAAVLRASMDRPNPGAAYNLADDGPAPSRAVTEHACALLGVEPPPLVPFEEADLTPMARSFWADNKRVSNRRIKEELGIRLCFPGYRDGLAAQLAEERAPGKDAADTP